MINEVENFLNKYNIINKKVIIGFSGGPDSCALAYILSKLKDKYKLKLVLGYFNHNWRVQEAKIEQEYASVFAKNIGAEFYYEVASEDVKKTEEVARELRYQFFEHCMKKFNSNVVFLAHNLDDNIETLIYRLIKGTSIKGLTSIAEKRDNFYRPLLNVEKKDILNFLTEKNIEYKFDSSNNNTKYKRNYIRKEILPKFEKLNLNYKKNIQILIRNAQNSTKIIENSISNLTNELIIDNKIVRNEFISLNEEYRLEILNSFIGDKLKYRTYKNLCNIDEFILNNKNSKMSLNKKQFLISDDFIYVDNYINTNENRVVIDSCGEYCFEGGMLKISKIEKIDKNFPDSDDFTCFLNLTFPLVIRHRMNGDIFSPLGLKNGKMKLKDYFINEKIKNNQKNLFVLLCRDNEVLWIIGNRISEKYKVVNKNCYKIVWSKNG